jgi:hypothetical protein
MHRIALFTAAVGVGGDSTMQVHTMYGDPMNDYGIKFNGAE